MPGILDFGAFGVSVEAGEVLSFFSGSELLQKRGFGNQVKNLAFVDGKMDVTNVEMNSYYASVAVDFMRRKLLEQGTGFTFESVMSHPGKVDLLAEAQGAGYRTYLYYVATDDPEINISRVQNRVALGGHSVPDDKVVSRYHRSLDLLMEAIRRSNRAYVFDNSTDNADGRHTWLAEIIDGRALELKTDSVPAWFRRAVLDKVV